MAKNKSKAVDCIACGQMIRVPITVSASTRLKCPLCQTRFRLADVLQQDVPMAQIENIEEDDDSSVLPPLEETEVRKNRQKSRSNELKHPSSPRWKLAANKAEANHTKGSTDGGLFSSTSKQVFAEDFPYSAKEKEKSQHEEKERKERRSRFPKKRLSEKPIGEQPFGMLKTSRRQPRSPEEAAENGHFPEGVDPLAIPMKSLHQPLPMKEKHTVLGKKSEPDGTELQTLSKPSSVQKDMGALDSDKNLNVAKVNAQDNSNQRLVSKKTARRSEDSRRAPWVDLVVMLLCCIVSLPLVQLGLWWVAGVDPLGIAPTIRSVAPLVVPAADNLE